MAVDRFARVMLIAAPPLLLIAPVLEFLGTQSLPLFVSPSLALVGGVGLLGLVCGGLAATLLPGRDGGVGRQVVFVGVVVIVVALAVDIAVGGHRIMDALAPATASLSPLARRVARLGLFLVAAGLVFGGIWRIRRHAASILAVCSFAFFLSTVVINARVFLPPATTIPPVRASTPKTSQPIVLYIVLDEAMGVEGLESVVPGGPALAADVRAFAERHRFRLHGGAFSRNVTSGRSIPNVLNFDFHDDGYGPYLAHDDRGRVQSQLFRNLAHEGYEVVSYDTEHLDFCFAVADRCEMMPSFNPYSPYVGEDDGTLPLTDARRAERKALTVYFLARSVFLESSVLYRYINWLSALHPTRLPDVFYAVNGYAFPKWFERFAADVAASPRGRAYFAHLLMPHSPYIFDEACRQTGEILTGYFLTEQYGLTEDALDRERARIYAAYVGQYRCALRTVDRLLSAVDQLPQFQDATIVVMGDHGARISAGMHVESMSERDMIDNYPALYAIRGPGIQPGYDLRKTSIQRLSAEYFSGKTPDELGPDELTVSIDRQEAEESVSRPMPDFGAARAQVGGGGV